MGIDEAQLRKEIAREIRAELEAEMRAEQLERQRKAELDAAFAPAIQSANREQQWERGRVHAGQVSDAAKIIGAALTEQMVAGLPGTHIYEDGFGDGTNR